MNFDYTPGPWKIMKERNNIVIMPKKSNSGNGHKYCAVGGGNIDANAKLISCAPEMIESLVDLIIELECFHQGNPLLRNSGELDEYKKLVEKAMDKTWDEVIK